MSLVPMSDLLREAHARGYAVPAFCVWNLETARAVLETASALSSPVILMHGPGEIPLLSPAEISTSVRQLSERYPLPAALHLDHGDSLEQVEEYLGAGFTSVMLDYSTRPYAENAAALREVTARAHPLGVTVEGELGHVGRNTLETVEGSDDSTLTDPEEAAAYVAETGVEALAVSIGNAHGQYTRLPRLDFDRLAAIRERVGVPLVLHGGSGTPEADLRQAISLGIAKVNVATDLITAFRQSLLDQWTAGRNPWAPMALAEALRAYSQVARLWIRQLGSDGRV